MRERLLAWQWSDYAAKHRTRANLRIHMLAVPLFQAGTVLLVYGAVAVSGAAAALAVLCMAASLALEGRGHRLEPETPTPFDGPGDFVARYVAEQWITFPRFVLSGAWYRALRRP
jgi:hypothetical protein